MHKNNFLCFPLLILFYVQYASSMNGQKNYDYDSYVFPLVHSTHEINQAFSDALLAKDGAAAQRYINRACINITELEETIKNFGQLQKKKVKSAFKKLSRHGSPLEKDIIKSIQNALDYNYTNSLCGSVTSSFAGLRDQLRMLGIAKTTEEFYSKLNTIKDQYDSIFKKFKFIPGLGNRSNTIIARCQNHIATTLMPYEAQIEEILNNKNNIQARIKNKPSLPNSSKNLLIFPERICTIISWLPFRDPLFNWILQDKNKFIKKRATQIMGSERYKERKKGFIFKMLQLVNNIIPIGRIITKTYEFYQKPKSQALKDSICERIDQQEYFDYARALQEYSFIELLECLGSVEFLKR
jgi:hypothetical protein